MSERVKIVLFTVGITAFFGLLITGVESALAPKKEMNAKVANQRVILQLFGLKPLNEEWPGEKVLGEFAGNVEAAVASDSQGKDLRFFRLKDAKKGRVFVFPFKGRGFWDTIYGYLAVDAASQTIKSIEFTLHGETPGLGGRISEPAFKERFRDRSLNVRDEAGRWFKLVAEGTARHERPAELDGITGASETSRSVETMLNLALVEITAILAKEVKP